nr:uncharacterized protein LOC115844705 [Globicephala melas]
MKNLHNALYLHPGSHHVYPTTESRSECRVVTTSMLQCHTRSRIFKLNSQVTRSTRFWIPSGKNSSLGAIETPSLKLSPPRKESPTPALSLFPSGLWSRSPALARPRPGRGPQATLRAAGGREPAGLGGAGAGRGRSGGGGGGGGGDCGVAARDAARGRPAGRGRRGAWGSPAFPPRSRQAAILRSCLRWRRRLSSLAAHRSLHRLYLLAAAATPGAAAQRPGHTQGGKEPPTLGVSRRRPTFPHSRSRASPETLRWRREVSGPSAVRRPRREGRGVAALTARLARPHPGPREPRGSARVVAAA